MTEEEEAREFDVVLLDGLHGVCPHCACAKLPHDSATVNQDLQVFLLNSKDQNNRVPSSSSSSSHVHALLTDTCNGRSNVCVHVLDATPGSVTLTLTLTEALFRFKERVDELGFSSVRVITSQRGRRHLGRYQHRLFTEMYGFTWVTCHTWDTCRAEGHAGPRHTHSHTPRQTHSHTDAAQRGQKEEEKEALNGAEEEEEEEEGDDVIDEEVTSFVQQLPSLNGPIRVLQSALIPADIFGHGFSLRSGGVSMVSTLSSLNLYCSFKRRDPEVIVQENRRRLAKHAGFYPKTMVLPKVSHGNTVWVYGDREPVHYDSIVTDRTGLVLAAPGADCMTLLFADGRSKVIGVAHAGWRGTLLGVAAATVVSMTTRFGCQPGDIIVAVGPSIGPCCFTLTDRKHIEEFLSIHPDCVTDPHTERPHVNIRLANRVLLQKAGILPQNIHDDQTDRQTDSQTDSQSDKQTDSQTDSQSLSPPVTLCSSCCQLDCFSHRRDGSHFGTQVGFIWTRGEEEEDTQEENVS